MNARPVVVAKVGGSLYELPDLAARLHNWLASEELEGSRVVLFPGGGAAADVVRDLDRTHALGEEAAHWLALRALTLNADFLAALLPEARRIALPAEWRETHLAILDPHAFFVHDEQNNGRMPHTWDVTSDSLSVRVAAAARAAQLVLLKSVSWEASRPWREAVRAGIVDAHFPEALARLPAGCSVSVVNLRDGRWGNNADGSY